MKRGRPRLDLTGQRYGRLTVQEPAPDHRRSGGLRSAWWCLCDCGERVSIATVALRDQETRSCGCITKERVAAGIRPRITAPIGQRFGRLVVEADATTPPGKTVWLCRCDCGQPKKVTAGNLKSGNSRSCGCTRRGRS